jgi:hypothetical protein
VNPALWIHWFAPWLSPRRLRAQAMMLALCLWGVCVADYSTPGLFDRAGNIKFQDFFQFPVSATLIAQGRADELYNPEILTNALREVAGPGTRVRLQYFYGPQVALPFIVPRTLSFLAQGAIWVAFSVLLYFGCVYLIWKTCSALKSWATLVALCAIAYPPLFHFFVRGQISVLPLVCFTAAYLAFRARRDWLAGIALGFLFIKPQFLVAVPVVLLWGESWRAFAGLLISAGAQLGLTFAYFGERVMRAYVHMLLHSASQPGYHRTQPLAHPDAFLAFFLGSPDCFPGHRMGDLPLEFHRGDRGGRRHLEVVPFSPASFFCFATGGCAGQSASLCLRFAGLGSGFAPHGRLGCHSRAASLGK